MTRKSQRRALINWLLSLVPPSLQDFIMQRIVRVPLFAYDPRLTVEIARTKEDLEAAYALLYKCYVNVGLDDPNEWGVRVNLYSFLPETTVIVVKLEKEIIGTVSLIRDSSMGLYCDSQFKQFNDDLRSTQNRLIEVSALAVDPEFRSQGHAISFLLMKFIYWYARFWMYGSHFVCVVASRTKPFYRALFGFEAAGTPTSYRNVKGVEGIYLKMPLSNEHTEKLLKWHVREVNSIVDFFLFHTDYRMKFPQRTFGQAIDPVMKPEFLNYFLLERTQMVRFFEQAHLDKLIEMYSGIFDDLGPIARFASRSKKYDKKPFRLTVEIECQIIQELNGQSQESPAKILDISESGCFLNLENAQELSIDVPMRLRFRHQNKSVEIEGIPRWRDSNNPGVGYGLQFSQSLLIAKELLGEWGQNKNRKAA